MFELWPMGRYGYIIGQNHTILLKNRQILEKMYNHFIFTSISNSCESSHDKCHRLSFFYVPNTVSVFYWSFWGKNHRLLMKICETVTGQ
jgi:hypothetical protein